MNEEIAEVHEELAALHVRLAALYRAEARPVWSRNKRSVIVQLWRRLGDENRTLLWELSDTYDHRYPFTLSLAANDLGTDAKRIRARLMNIGRSLKSLGSDFDLLWDTEWTGSENEYRWDREAQTAIQELGAK